MNLRNVQKEKKLIDAVVSGVFCPSPEPSRALDYNLDMISLDLKISALDDKQAAFIPRPSFSFLPRPFLPQIHSC